MALSRHFKLRIFPSGYRIFHKDRADGFGDVLIACQNGITCNDIHIDSPTELNSYKQTYINNHQSVIVCSIYRTPDRNMVTMENLLNAFEMSRRGWN